MTKDEDRPRCRLLDLPVELRLLIYQYTRRTITLKSLIASEKGKAILVSNDALPPYIRHVNIQGAPYVALLTTCSVVHKEYLQFYPNLDAAGLEFTFKQLYNHSAVDEFGSLGCHLDYFDRITDTLETSLCNVSTLTLRIDCGRDTHPRVQMSRLDNLLGSFSRLQKLNIEVICFTQFYQLFRRLGRSSQPMSLILDQFTAWRDSRPQLDVHETLIIYCDFAETMSDSWGSPLGYPQFAYFKGTPTTSPISWEGLDLEPIELT